MERKRDRTGLKQRKEVRMWHKSIADLISQVFCKTISR